MPTSTGAFSEAEIESIEKQLPCEPFSGAAGTTDSGDWRSVKTLNHWRKTRSTFGSYSRGTRLSGSATRTQPPTTGFLADGNAQEKTPSGFCTMETSAVPPRAP